MAWDSGSITSTTSWDALSAKLKALCGTSGVENWSFVERVPAGTGQGQSGAATYHCDVFKCAGTNTQQVPVNFLNKLATTNTTDAAVFTFNPGNIDPQKGYILSVINTKASAADQPVTPAFTGANAPVFVLLKTQAGGNVGEVRVSTYLAKPTFQDPFVPTAIDDTAFPPSQDDELMSGTIQRFLTVNFSASQTGIGILMEEVTGLDWSQDITTVGATGIAVQTVGAFGTVETAHTGTLATIGSNSVVYAVAGEANGTGNYTAGSEWIPNQADVTFATPTTHMRSMWNPDGNDVSGTLTLSSATSETSWAYVALELKRAPAFNSNLTTLNDCGSNWYFVIEVPVTDGAVVSAMNACEDYEYGAKVFGGMAFAGAATAPVGTKYWVQTGYNLYANYTNNNRTPFALSALNTSGFQYYIKLTKNAVLISTRVSGTETSAYAGLLDSFVTNTTDRVPLTVHIGAGAPTTGSAFSSLPGITSLSGGTASRGWQASSSGWTHNVLTQGASEGGSLFNNALSTNVDAWQGGKTYVARIVEWHSYGLTSGTVASTSGYYRGLVKSDFLCIGSGGTVQIGDTMIISGVTWTVIKLVGINGTSGQSMSWLTRAL